MKKFIAVILTLAIPVLLLLTVLQASRYTVVERDFLDYTKEQNRIIDENNRKISAITILSKAERIEKIAIEKLGMRKAKPSEITRVSFSDDGDLNE